MGWGVEGRPCRGWGGRSVVLREHGQERRCVQGAPSGSSPSKTFTNARATFLQGQELQVQQTWIWHKTSWRRLTLTPP